MGKVKALKGDTATQVTARYYKRGFGKIDSSLAIARWQKYMKALSTGIPQ